MCFNARQHPLLLAPLAPSVPMHGFTLSTSFVERCLTPLPRNGASCNEAHWDVVLFGHLSDLLALFLSLPSHLPVWLIYPLYPPPFFMLSCFLQRTWSSCNRPSKQSLSSSKSTHRPLNSQHNFSNWDLRSLHGFDHFYFCIKMHLEVQNIHITLCVLLAHLQIQNSEITQLPTVQGVRFVWIFYILVVYFNIKIA